MLFVIYWVLLGGKNLKLGNASNFLLTVLLIDEFSYNIYLSVFMHDIWPLFEVQLSNLLEENNLILRVLSGKCWNESVSMITLSDHINKNWPAVASNVLTRGRFTRRTSGINLNQFVYGFPQKLDIILLDKITITVLNWSSFLLCYQNKSVVLNQCAQYLF